MVTPRRLQAALAIAAVFAAAAVLVVRSWTDRWPVVDVDARARQRLAVTEERGRAALRAVRLDEAADAFRLARSDARAMGDDALSGRFTFLLGLVAQVRGDATRARALYREAMAEGHRDAALLNDLAWAHEALGAVDEAVDALRESVEAGGPREAFHRENLGVLLVRREAWDEAREQLRAAMRVAPDAPRAHRALMEVHARRPEGAVGYVRDLLARGADGRAADAALRVLEGEAELDAGTGEALLVALAEALAGRTADPGTFAASEPGRRLRGVSSRRPALREGIDELFAAHHGETAPSWWREPGRRGAMVSLLLSLGDWHREAAEGDVAWAWGYADAAARLDARRAPEAVLRLARLAVERRDLAMLERAAGFRFPGEGAEPRSDVAVYRVHRTIGGAYHRLAGESPEDADLRARAVDRLGRALAVQRRHNRGAGEDVGAPIVDPAAVLELAADLEAQGRRPEAFEARLDVAGDYARIGAPGAARRVLPAPGAGVPEGVDGRVRAEYESLRARLGKAGSGGATGERDG